MEKIYLNKELSKELYDKGKYVPKHCYDNVFDNIGSVGRRFMEEEIKIMFCYVSVSIGGLKNIYTRHACYYLEGMAIDPTIISVHKESIYDLDYIPFKVMSVNEYFDLLSREGRADLFKTLREVEELKQGELRENGIALIG